MPNNFYLQNKVSLREQVENTDECKVASGTAHGKLSIEDKSNNKASPSIIHERGKTEEQYKQKVN